MPARKVAVAPVPDALVQALAAIRERLEIPQEFGDDVLSEAERAARDLNLPDLDRTDLEFVTIDPPGARDLDQALHIAERDGGYVVSYAIADVAAFVTPGGAVDREAHRRGLTLYAPDRKAPLHPPGLSEDAASLLPGKVRPALLWTLRLDSHGRLVDADVARARVRSREQLTYEQAQIEIDGGRPRPTLALLKTVGRCRELRERERGGVSLPLPEQEIRTDDGPWRLAFRAPLPVEGWNAQISLLTGMAAAHLMIYGQVGILRTMPPPEHESLRRLRQVAKALQIHWPAELDYPEFVRSLDPTRPTHAAMLNECTLLFRGSGYLPFRGALPADAEHAALASDYAHVTAPLRRLVDRYTGEICLALCADRPVPEWVLQGMDAVPAEMQRAERLAKRFERDVIDVVEVFLLQSRVGEEFTGTVIDVDENRRRGRVMLAEPAVEAPVTGAELPLGRRERIRLVSADLRAGSVRFEVVGEAAPAVGELPARAEPAVTG
jgi:exoribonuclease R